MAPLLGRRRRDDEDSQRSRSEDGDDDSGTATPARNRKIQKLKEVARDRNGRLAESQSQQTASPESQRHAHSSQNDAMEEEQDLEPETDDADIDLSRLNRGDQDDDEEEGEDNEHDEETEANERALKDRMQAEREAARANRIQRGGSRQHGQVASLELVNFMCHANLKMTFGKKLNFVIGHNGSGKSAILTALTIVLGGKANTTGRAPSLKDFIKYGSDAALIVLRLTNKGSEAYRPGDYGDFIQIERRLSRDGTSAYTLKSATGRVVSRERAELTNICEAMNLQVDNPMNILSQDAARQFLSASTPEDKYRQWLRGIQLTQLKEEYQRIRTHLDEIRAIVKHRQKGIPELEDAVRQAKRRFEEMQANNDLRYKVQELHAMVAWAYVADKEAAVERQRSRCEDIEQKISEINETVTRLTTEQGKREGILSSLDQELAAEERKKLPYLAQMQACRKETAQIARTLQDHRNAMAEMDDDLEREQRSIDSYHARIAEARRQLEAETRGAKDVLVQRLHSAQSDLKELQDEQVDVTQEKSRIESDLIEGKKRVQRLRTEQQARKDELETATAMHANLIASQKDSLAIWGAPMPNLCAAIKRINDWHEAPLGPIGRFVNIDRPEWVEVLDAVIGTHMSSFIVTNNRDRNRLNELVGQYFKNHDRPNIIMTDRDHYDYTSGEPDDRFLTILRVVTIPDEFVLRQLITLANVEASILVDKRADADHIMANPPANVMNCYTRESGGYKVGGRHGLQQSVALRKNRGGVRFQRNIALEIQKLQELLPNLRHELSSVANAQQEQDEALTMLTGRHKQLDQRQAQLRGQLRMKGQEIEKVQEEMAETMSVSITSLEDGLKESEGIYANSEAQRKVLQEVITRTESELEPIAEKAAQIQIKIDIVDQEIAGIREQMREHRVQAHQKDTDIATWGRKVAALVTQQRTSLADLDNRKLDLATKTAQASEIGARVDSNQEIRALERQLAAAQTQIRNADRRQTLSFEQIQQDFIDKKEALEAAKADFRDMQAFGEHLHKALADRINLWLDFRQSIAIRCKHDFSRFLNSRNYSGTLRFLHNAGKLEISVRTESRAQEDAAEKNPKTLSGGEKSFSTICLLMCMWSAMHSPLRGLDEFDVFMDAVNRRISVRLIMDVAKDDPTETQYILITPQGIENVKGSADVHISRMGDPERRAVTAE